MALAGCHLVQRERNCAPACPEAFCENTNGGPYFAPPPDVFQALADRLQANAPPPNPANKKYNVLAISGGGKYGAYSVGVLTGWTAAGNRPTFDVVTGVSTGSLVALFAFLGPQYDGVLERYYLNATERDIYRRKPILVALLTSSFASNAPLRQGIREAVSDEVVADLAAAHASGRRLLLGTTNLDTKRLAVWDVGAIAASDRPDRRELICKILVAATAVPGQFPPEKFDVTINGKTYTELHVDGGVSSEVFIRLAHLNIPQEQLAAGPRPLAGSNIYTIISGKVYADPKCVTPTLLGILGNSVSSLISAMTQNDLIRIYTLSLLTGMNFQFTALRQDYQDASGGALSFDPAEQRKLYAEGYRVGLQGGVGDGWRTQPPAVLRNEQAVPRTGTEFAGPYLPR